MFRNKTELWDHLMTSDLSVSSRASSVITLDCGGHFLTDTGYSVIRTLLDE